MIRDELDDFDLYWRESLFESDGTKKSPGESDYTSLIAWAKGNSISVDQSTISIGRSLMTLLVDRLKNCLIGSDGPIGLAIRHYDKTAGVTLHDLEKEFGKAKMGKKFRGKVNRNWFRIESMLQVLFKRMHIDLYQSDNTLISRKEESHLRQVVSESTEVKDRNRMWIVDFLSRNYDDGAHFRLNHERLNWDTYIRDRYGAPPNTQNILPGNLDSGLEIRPKHVEVDLHLAYGETISRRVTQFSGKERGLGQLEARKKVCDFATNNDDRMVPLDVYYRIFRMAAAEHMADYYLLRSTSDRSAAWFKIHEVEGSNPKKWMVEVDPDLVRWRELSRDRARERVDGDNINDDETEMVE